MRDEKGRWLAGTCGNPDGKPKRVKVFRDALLGAVTEQDILDVVQSIVKAAKAADMVACKLLLSYVVGQPAGMFELDEKDGIPPDIARLPVPEQRRVIQEHVQVWLAADAALERVEKRMQPDEQPAKEEMQ